jgi:hypothetical protein
MNETNTQQRLPLTLASLLVLALIWQIHEGFSSGPSPETIAMITRDLDAVAQRTLVEASQRGELTREGKTQGQYAIWAPNGTREMGSVTILASARALIGAVGELEQTGRKSEADKIKAFLADDDLGKPTLDDTKTKQD